MKSRILCFLFFAVITAWVCNATPVSLNTDEQEARNFAHNASLKLFNIYDELSHEIFESNEEIDTTKMEELSRKIAKQKREILNASKQFHDENFTDPELKYAFKKLRDSIGENILDDDKSVGMFLCKKYLRDLASEKTIPAYHNKSIELSFSPDLQDIFAKRNDPEELKYYWLTFRDINGDYGAGTIEDLIEVRKEVAKIKEITPLKFFLKEYNITEMENVMKQIEPLYIQLHGFIRKQLQKKYGDEVVKPNDPIPHHLFEQVLAQVWTSESILEEMYPHKNLPQYVEILKQNNYDTLKMFKMADQFFKSLGFDSVPDEYWGTNFKMNPYEDKGDCNLIFTYKSPNVQMRFCQKINSKNFLQTYMFMGAFNYAREKIDLPAYYFDSYDLQYPVGEAVVISALTIKHLDNIGLVTDLAFNDELQINILLRRGIYALLKLRVRFVHTKVMADLYSGSVNMTDINKHYWKLMEKYVGASRPSPVDPYNPGYDFSSQFYTEFSDGSLPRKFMADILGYQFYEKFCEISGQYSRSIKSEPLNNCDFFGSKKVGDALKKMMRLGSSKPMREVLATIFPENPTVNAESLIEYYAPIKTWLIETNRKNNVTIGWSHSDVVKNL